VSWFLSDIYLSKAAISKEQKAKKKPTLTMGMYFPSGKNPVV